MSVDGAHWQRFSEKSVGIGLKVSKRDDVLAKLVELAVGGGALDVAQSGAVLKALVAREKLGSTGLGGGVAIPHVKTDSVEAVVTAVAVCSSPVDYGAVDGEPCNVFILLLSPTAQAERHLEMLRWVSRLVRNQDFARFIRRARSNAEVISLLREMGE